MEVSVNWCTMRTTIVQYGVDIIPFHNCDVGPQIGTGAAMTVYKGTCVINDTVTDVAFKEHRKLNNARIDKRALRRITDELRHEIHLMNILRTQSNIVQIIAVTFTPEGKPVLIVELASDTLDHYLYRKSFNSNRSCWYEKAKLCLDITMGLRSIHDAGIIHGDIKGENILIFETQSETPVAKISDFGFSSTLTSMKDGVGGTYNFMAPEVTGKYPELHRWHKRPMLDIYSFGLVVFQVATDGMIPYEDTDDVIDLKDSNFYLKYLLGQMPKLTPEVFRTIMTLATKFHPEERPTLDFIECAFKNYITGAQNTTKRQSITFMRMAASWGFFNYMNL